MCIAIQHECGCGGSIHMYGWKRGKKCNILGDNLFRLDVHNSGENIFSVRRLVREQKAHFLHFACEQHSHFSVEKVSGIGKIGYACVRRVGKNSERQKSRLKIMIIIEHTKILLCLHWDSLNTCKFMCAEFLYWCRIIKYAENFFLKRNTRQNSISKNNLLHIFAPLIYDCVPSSSDVKLVCSKINGFSIFISCEKISTSLFATWSLCS